MSDNTTYLTTDGKNAIALNIQDPTDHPLNLSAVKLYNEAPVITSDGNIDTSGMVPTATSGTNAITCLATNNLIQISTTISNATSYSAKTMLIFFTENSEEKVFAYYTQENSDTFPEVSVFNMILKVENEYNTTVTFENPVLEAPLASTTVPGKVQFKNPPCFSDIDLDSNNVPYVLRPSQVEAGYFIGTAVINPADEGIDYIKQGENIIQLVKNMFVKGSELSLPVDQNTTISFTASQEGEADITGTLSWQENVGESRWEAENDELDGWLSGGHLKIINFDYNTSVVIFDGENKPNLTDKTLTLSWNNGAEFHTFTDSSLWTSQAYWHKALANSTGSLERWVSIPENHFSKVTITFTSQGETPEFSQVYEHIFIPADNTDGTSPSVWTLPIVPTPEAQTDYLVTVVEKIY